VKNKMGKAKIRYSVTLKKYPKGHGFRTQYATSKKGAEKIGKTLGGKKGYSTRKLKKPKLI